LFSGTGESVLKAGQVRANLRPSSHPSGLGGLTVPFIASALLETYGRRVTCIAFSIAYAILLALTIPFIRPRLPLTNRLTDADAQRERARIDWGFLRGRAFWLLACGVVLQGLGGFVPGTYLPCEFYDLRHRIEALIANLYSSLCRIDSP